MQPSARQPMDRLPIERDANSLPVSVSPWPWTEIVVGLLFAVALVGLTHDTANLSRKLEDSVEAGRDMENVEAFHKDVNAAPVHRKLGFVLLLSLACFCLVTAPGNTQFHNGLVILLVGCCLAWLSASFFWSADWRHTARESVRIVAYGFVAWSLALRFRPQQLCLVLMIALAGSVFAAVGASVVTGHLNPGGVNSDCAARCIPIC